MKTEDTETQKKTAGMAPMQRHVISNRLTRITGFMLVTPLKTTISLNEIDITIDLSKMICVRDKIIKNSKSRAIYNDLCDKFPK